MKRMKTLKQVIEEIERDLKRQREIPIHLQSDYSQGYENALDNILEFINEENNLDGVKDD